MGRWYFIFVLYFFLLDGGCTLPGEPSPSPGNTRMNIAGFPDFSRSSSNLFSQKQRSSLFPYGLASGDPLPDGVVIWSMLNPQSACVDSSARWEVSQQPDFSTVAASGSLRTNRRLGYRLKVDVRGLQPATPYYYRFGQGEQWSETGRTLTAPAGEATQSVSLAVVSCNALEWGYFNAYGNLAKRDDLDAVVHLGDYIYEYASGVYGDTSIGRWHEPRHEVITRQDYHQRYARYRSDPQLQAAHRAHPFICVWDDHEVANDSHLAGAENHDPCIEGDYLTRMTAAKQVYYNWMPIREKADGSINRSFSFGGLADLHMLDERLTGRNHPASSFTEDDLRDRNRSMLGKRQFNWLCRKLKNGTARWQLIGNQVLFAKLDLSDILPRYAVNLDAWDGYAYEQGRLKDSLSHYNNPNTVFLTGDTHCSWYFDIPDDAGNLLAHELATPSISSANYDEFIGGWDTLTVARYRLYRDNDHLNYTNIKDHGYLHLALTPDRLTATFHYSKSIRYVTEREKVAKTFTINYANHRISAN